MFPVGAGALGATGVLPPLSLLLPVLPFPFADAEVVCVGRPPRVVEVVVVPFTLPLPLVVLVEGTGTVAVQPGNVYLAPSFMVSWTVREERVGRI